MEHIALHGVSPGEAEYVLEHPTLELGYEDRSGEERYAEVGATARGRILVVWTTWRGARPGLLQPLTHRNRKFRISTNGDTMKERSLPPVPQFANEAEEAQWLFDHREDLSRDIASAAKNGTLGEGSMTRGARKLKEAQKRNSAA